MQAVVEITFPVFAIVACGFIAARRRLLSEEAVTGLNAFVFWFALPAMLAKAVASLPLQQVFDLRMLLAYAAGALGLFAFGYFAHRSANGVERTALALNATHGNIGYLGFPLVAQLGDQRLMAPAIIVMMVDVTVLIVLSLVLFEFHAARRSPPGAAAGTAAGAAAGIANPSRPAPLSHLAGALVAVLRSPLIFGIAAGAVLSLTQWQPPVIVDRFIALIAAAASPCALFAIGAAFGSRVIRIDVPVTSQIVLKLLVYPVWVGLVFHLCGVDPAYAAIGILCASLPAASNTFILGRRYGADTTTLSAAIVVGTAIAALTVSAAIALLRLT